MMAAHQPPLSFDSGGCQRVVVVDDQEGGVGKFVPCLGCETSTPVLDQRPLSLQQGRQVRWCRAPVETAFGRASSKRSVLCPPTSRGASPTPARRSSFAAGPEMGDGRGHTHTPGWTLERERGNNTAAGHGAASTRGSDGDDGMTGQDGWPRGGRPDGRQARGWPRGLGTWRGGEDERENVLNWRDDGLDWLLAGWQVQGIGTRYLGKEG